MPTPEVPEGSTQAAPRRIGAYVIQGSLGEGAMGRVLLGRHEKGGPPVAIKILHGDLSDRMRRRFFREVSALRKLDHPGIVRFIEAGEHDGVPYLVMEHVEGASLERWIREDIGTRAERVDLVRRIALAMDEVHRRGIVHRDLKPQNIIVRGDGTPVVLDFGLMLDVDRMTRFTIDGVSIGTPAYMSPEQVMGDQGTIGPATDVYSLGSIFYELLCGRPPFQKATVVSLYQSIVKDEVPRPTEVRPGIPAAVDAIVMKALAKEPGDRYASMADLAQDLDRLLGGEAPHAVPPGFSRRLAHAARRQGWQGVAILALSLFTVAAIVIAALFVRQAQNEAVRARRDADEARRALTERDDAAVPRSPAPSPSPATSEEPLVPLDLGTEPPPPPVGLPATAPEEPGSIPPGSLPVGLPAQPPAGPPVEAPPRVGTPAEPMGPPPGFVRIAWPAAEAHVYGLAASPGGGSAGGSPLPLGVLSPSGAGTIDVPRGEPLVIRPGPPPPVESPLLAFPLGFDVGIGEPLAPEPSDPAWFRIGRIVLHGEGSQADVPTDAIDDLLGSLPRDAAYGLMLTIEVPPEAATPGGQTLARQVEAIGRQVEAVRRRYDGDGHDDLRRLPSPCRFHDLQYAPPAGQRPPPGGVPPGGPMRMPPPQAILAGFVGDLRQRDPTVPIAISVREGEHPGMYGDLLRQGCTLDVPFAGLPGGGGWRRDPLGQGPEEWRTISTGAPRGIEGVADAVLQAASAGCARLWLPWAAVAAPGSDIREPLARLAALLAGADLGGARRLDPTTGLAGWRIPGPQGDLLIVWSR